MVRGGGARGGTSGSAAGGLAAVAEIEGADDAPASPSLSPAAARQEHLQQHMLAAHTQLAQLFPGGLPQPQAALQAYPTLVGGNAPQPPSADLASVLAALSQPQELGLQALGLRSPPRPQEDLQDQASHPARLDCSRC